MEGKKKRKRTKPIRINSMYNATHLVNLSISKGRLVQRGFCRKRRRRVSYARTHRADSKLHLGYKIMEIVFMPRDSFK